MNARIVGKLKTLQHLDDYDEATIELSSEDSLTLKNCLDYCKHRLRKHDDIGLFKTGCRVEMIEGLLEKWFPEKMLEEPKKEELPDGFYC